MLLGLFFACGGDVVHHPDTPEDSALEGLAITALDPAEGVAAGGTFVRVEGQAFTSASSVTVGGAACAELTFLSSAELFCSTPPGAVGTTELLVTDGSTTASAAFTYLADDADTAEDTGEPPATITGCTLESPTSMIVEEDSASDLVLGSVVVAGRTDGDGQGPGVEGEVGFGPAGTEPQTWEWTPLAYTASVDTADQYDGTFFPDGVGLYEYTVRFRVDHGEWTVCAAAGGGRGTLEATPTSVENPVDYCHLQWPCSAEVAAGTESGATYAWIYQGGVTQGVGQGGGVLLELGIGDAGSDPETDGSWVWSSMAYNADKDGLTPGDAANDEYMGHFTAPTTVGTYDYVARASADLGLTWTICDLGGDSCNYGGSSDGYDDPGVCTVN